MCIFFSFCTEPEHHGGQRFYFDWNYRSKHLKDENDSHSLIAKYYNLDEDICNKYEFNPLTKVFNIDQINSHVDDRIQAEDWVNRLDFKRIVGPLVIKPIVNPILLPMVAKPTEEQIQLLKSWASVWDSVRDSVGASVWDSVMDSVGASVVDSVWDSVGASVVASVRDSVRDSVGASVWASVRDSVRDSVGASVWDSVWSSVVDSVRASVMDSVRAYTSSFFDIQYKHDFSSCISLWEAGLVPSFDGETWRLHSGVKAAIVFAITDNELRAP